MGEPLLNTESHIPEKGTPDLPPRHLAIVETLQPEDQSPQAVFVSEAPTIAAVEEVQLALCTATIRRNFAVAARDGLGAVVAREPIKVDAHHMGPLLPYQFRTWPAYLLECRRYARDHQAALACKVRADRRLADAEQAVMAASEANTYTPNSYIAKHAPEQPGHSAYVRHAAYTGLKFWIKTRLA